MRNERRRQKGKRRRKAEAQRGKCGEQGREINEEHRDGRHQWERRTQPALRTRPRSGVAERRLWFRVASSFPPSFSSTLTQPNPEATSACSTYAPMKMLLAEISVNCMLFLTANSKQASHVAWWFYFSVPGQINFPASRTTFSPQIFCPYSLPCFWFHSGDRINQSSSFTYCYPLLNFGLYQETLGSDFRPLFLLTQLGAVTHSHVLISSVDWLIGWLTEFHSLTWISSLGLIHACSDNSMWGI